MFVDELLVVLELVVFEPKPAIEVGLDIIFWMDVASAWVSAVMVPPTMVDPDLICPISILCLAILS